MSMDGQGTKRRKEIAENFNRLSRVHERYRQRDDRHTTDGRAIAYSEREFTFAKNELMKSSSATDLRSVSPRHLSFLRLSVLLVCYYERVQVIEAAS